MASKPATATSCEVGEEEYGEYEEEYEEYEEEEIQGDVEGEDYEEAFEEEEEEIEQNEKAEEDEKKVVEVEDYEEEFEEEEEIEQTKEEDKNEKKVVKVQDHEEALEEEEEIEQKEEEEGEEIEQNEEEEEEKKVVKVQKVHEEVEESVQDPLREEEKSANPERPSESAGNALPPPAVFPPLLQSVSDLEKLHCALSKFLYEWNSLNRSLDSITAAIDAHASSQHDARSNEQEKDERSEQEEEKDELSEQEKEKDEHSEQEKKDECSELDKKDERSELDKKDERSEQEKKDDRSELEKKDQRSEQEKKDECSEHEKKDERSEQEKKDERSEQEEKDERSEQEKKDERSLVEILCQRMEGKALRKYLESNLSHLDRLRHVVPEALRGLPNPGKLVFDAIGKFYMQGRKAYDKSTQLVSYRFASVYLLEFFVLSGRPTGDSSVKEEANLAAHVWWKRLVKENIKLATTMDSLGLILFLACFGIPKDFGSKDLGILLLECDQKMKKIDVFRRSNILVEKIPGVIKDLIRGEMYFEAAELSCCFGLTDTFPPLPLLSSFVTKVIQNGDVERHQSHSSPKLVNEANIRELKSLRSVVKCLEDHKLDVNNLTCVNIHEKISKLGKNVEEIEMRLRKNDLKRKDGENPWPNSGKKNKVLTGPDSNITLTKKKRKAQHLIANMKSKAQTKESFPSPSEASQNAPSHMIHDKPLFPDSQVQNSTLSVAVNNTKDYPDGWKRKYFDSSAIYRFSAIEYPSSQHFYQPQGFVYGNGGRISGRNLYQFADTVIQHEEQLSKSNRSSNTSPAGAKFGHY